MIVSSSAIRILMPGTPPRRAGPARSSARACRAARRARARARSRARCRRRSPCEPAAVVGDRERDVAVRAARARSGPCRRRARARSGSSSLKTSASAVARSPASETGSSVASTVLPRAEALHEHRPQPLDQLGEVDVVLALLGQHLVHGRDREDPVDRVVERLPRVDLRRRAPAAAAATRRSGGCS